MTDKKIKIDQSERPWVREPKEHPLIQFVEDHHYGKIHETDVPYEVMYAAETRTRNNSFKWTKDGKFWKFSGRNTTKCSTFEKGPGRNAYLASVFGPNEWNEFDLHAAVPATMNLLLSGEWIGTDDTVHIRKDIHKRLGIDENAHGPEAAEVIKTVTMRWNFSTGVKRSTANFKRAHLWERKTPFSQLDLKGIYSEKDFIKGWFLYHSRISGIRLYVNDKLQADSLQVIDDWSKNNAHLKYSVFWWESRLENEAASSLRSNGFVVAQNYDCIYSNAPVCLIKAAFDDAASLVRNEYLSEKQAELYTYSDFVVSGTRVSLPKDPMSAFLLKNGRIPEQEDDDECSDWLPDLDVDVDSAVAVAVAVAGSDDALVPMPSVAVALPSGSTFVPVAVSVAAAYPPVPLSVGAACRIPCNTVQASSTHTQTEMETQNRSATARQTESRNTTTTTTAKNDSGNETTTDTQNNHSNTEIPATTLQSGFQDRLTRTGSSGLSGDDEDFLRSYRGMLDRSKKSRKTPGRPKGSPQVGGRPKGSKRVGGPKPGSLHRGSTGSVAGSHEKELATLRLSLTLVTKALIKSPGDAARLGKQRSLLEAIDKHLKEFGDNRHH